MYKIYLRTVELNVEMVIPPNRLFGAIEEYARDKMTLASFEAAINAKMRQHQWDDVDVKKVALVHGVAQYLNNKNMEVFIQIEKQDGTKEAA